MGARLPAHPSPLQPPHLLESCPQHTLCVHSLRVHLTTSECPQPVPRADREQVLQNTRFRCEAVREHWPGDRCRRSRAWPGSRRLSRSPPAPKPDSMHSTQRVLNKNTSQPTRKLYRNVSSSTFHKSQEVATTQMPISVVHPYNGI